jgi:hypothetical protein
MTGLSSTNTSAARSGRHVFAHRALKGLAHPEDEASLPCATRCRSAVVIVSSRMHTRILPLWIVRAFGGPFADVPAEEADDRV